MRSAVRLALALGDPGLRAAVERIADDRATAEALLSPLLPSGEPWGDENHAGNVDRMQERARLFLDGGGSDIGPTRRRGGN